MLNKKFHQTAFSIKNSIKKAHHILLIAHKNPDGDTIGSSLAFYEILKKQGKKVTIFCNDFLPDDFYFLSFLDNFKNDLQNIEQFDLAITLDCGADYMTGISEKFSMLFNKNFPLINIDHHPSNNNFGQINLIDPTACSTTLILTSLFQFLSWPISYQTATALLCGIYTDTGSFQHSNTNSDALRSAAFLMRKGARVNEISKHIFKTYKLEKLSLWGRILSRVYQNEEKIVISNVSDQDLIETNTEAGDISGVIDFLNSVPDCPFSLLLTEINGKVKASFRTVNNDIDVAKLASVFGGGGHKKAAGFTLPGKLKKEIHWCIVS